MGIAVGSEMGGSVTNVHIYNNTIGVCKTGPDPANGCGWGPVLPVKSTIARGGRITFYNNTVWNTSLFILVEMVYQRNGEERPPVGYESTLVKNISFLSNRALGSARCASFVCSRFDACHGLTAVDNHIVAAGTNGELQRRKDSKHNANNNGNEHNQTSSLSFHCTGLLCCYKLTHGTRPLHGRFHGQHLELLLPTIVT
jgi:hypothetical protein